MLGHPGHRSAVRHAFWARIRAGDWLIQAAVSSGVSQGTASQWFREAGGVMAPLTRPARKRPRLTFEQPWGISVSANKRSAMPRSPARSDVTGQRSAGN